MKKFSNTNLVRLSSGETISRQTLETRMNKEKNDYKLDRSLYAPYCDACGNPNTRLSVSHIVSVKECIEAGKSEQAYNQKNFQLECNQCHEEWETKETTEKNRVILLSKIVNHNNYQYKHDFIFDNFPETYKRLNAKGKI